MSYLSPISNLNYSNGNKFSINSPFSNSNPYLAVKEDADGKIAAAGDETSNKNPIVKDEKNPNQECQTCKNRKYQDGSDEMVSFKSPTHISPDSAAAAVRAHEQEHVSNAYSKAALDNGKVTRASVTIQTAVCPECGRSYVAGGTTRTQIKYFNESNPYQQDLKAADYFKYGGMNANYAV